MSKKLIIGCVCVVVVIVLFFGGRFLADMGKYRSIVAGIVIQTPDISLIQDGTYNGNCDAIIIAADVDVVVKDHKITDIKINEHKNGRGAGAEVITDEVLANQSLNVDTVSGATNSSKVILKAIETALENEGN